MLNFKFSVLAAAMFLSAGSLTHDSSYQQGVDAFLSGEYLRAANHYYMAATNGHAMAQNNLAAMYYMGQGVKEDPVSAYMWAGLALENGISSAGNFQAVFAADMSATEVKLATALTHECVSSGYSFCGLKAYASN
jgi:TPR repeat protein